MNQGNVSVGDVSEISGEVNIAGGSIYKGYTASQVTVLLEQIKTQFQPRPFDGFCPYKGLAAFEEGDANLFFGREKAVEDLVRRVTGSRSVFICGPSGSGKSSLVRAGLIPALKGGAIADLHSENWLYTALKPGRDPIEALALAISRLKTPDLGDYLRQHQGNARALNECIEAALTDQKDQRAVVFVDQFEEIFTQVSDETTRVTFLNLLANAANLSGGRTILLFSMRSDFIPNCAAYPQVNALLNQQFVQIDPMQPHELVSAIAQPALRVGLRIDPDLIVQIINDMRGEPGALPLMQFALKDLFDAEQARGSLAALTLENYLKRGGIHKSLERHADEAFEQLGESEKQLAHAIFSGLIEIGRGTQDTRRIALFDELVPGGAAAAQVQAVVQKLADARLITTGGRDGKETVTLAHEKLLDAWPWLIRLVNENREAIALQNEITNDAKEWDKHQRDPGYLYSQGRLARAREQIHAEKILLSGIALEFVQVGYARQRRAQASRIAAVFAIIILLGVAVIVFSRQSYENAQLANQNAAIANTAQAASTLAVANQISAQANAEEAQRQANLALARQLAAQAKSIFAISNSKQLTGVLLAVRSIQMHPSTEAARF